MTTKELVEVLNAMDAGKAIQYCEHGDSWVPVQDLTLPRVCMLAGRGFSLRTKPEPPKPREWWEIRHGRLCEDYKRLAVCETEVLAIGDRNRYYPGAVVVHVKEVL